MAKYANYQRVCDGLFVVFTLVWIMTRLGLYPFWIMRNTTVQAPKIVDMFPAYYIFNSLLFLLLALHIFWTYLILKIAYNSLLVGKVRYFYDFTSRCSNMNKSSLAIPVLFLFLDGRRYQEFIRWRNRKFSIAEHFGKRSQKTRLVKKKIHFKRIIIIIKKSRNKYL